MSTKEDLIREIDYELVWCMKVINDGAVLNKIQKLQNDIQHYSNKQLGELLDALEEFNADKPESISKVIEVADNIEKERKQR